MRMQSGLAMLWVASVTVLVAGLTGCKDLCDGAQQVGGEGARVRVTLVEEVTGPTYPVALGYPGHLDLSLPSCEGRAGLVNGVALQLRAVDAGAPLGGECMGLSMAVEMGPAELQLRDRGVAETSFLGSEYKAVLAGCPGTWRLRLEAASAGDVFEPPVPRSPRRELGSRDVPL